MSLEAAGKITRPEAWKVYTGFIQDLRFAEVQTSSMSSVPSFSEAFLPVRVKACPD